MVKNLTLALLAGVIFISVIFILLIPVKSRSIVSENANDPNCSGVAFTTIEFRDTTKDKHTFHILKGEWSTFTKSVDAAVAIDCPYDGSDSIPYKLYL